MRPITRWSPSAPFLAAVLVALLGLFGAGCDDNEEDPQRRVFGDAQLRLVHAAPDMPTVDIYIDDADTPAFSGVKYGDTTAFVTVAATSHTLQFRPAGAATSVPPLNSSAPIDLARDSSTSAVAAGLLQASSLDQSFRVLPLTEGYAPSAPGMLRMRFLNAGVDAPTLGVDVDGDGEAEVGNLARFQASGASGVELPAGQPLTLDLVPQDSTTTGTGFLLPPQPEGSQLLVVATGLLTVPPRLDTGFVLLVTNASGAVGTIRPNPVVYVLNASAAAGELDVFLGEDEEVGGLAFSALSPAIQVPSTNDALDIFPASPTSSRPGGDPLLTQATSGLSAGGRYLLIVTGTRAPGTVGSGPPMQLLSFAEAFEVDATHPRLRFIHSAPAFPALDAAPLDPAGNLPMSPEINDLAYTQASAAEGIQLPTVEFYLGVRPATDTTNTQLERYFIGPGPLAAAGIFGVFAEATDGSHRLVLVNTGVQPWSAQVLSPTPSGAP
ncbi:DUF4397 domain-containing protein [Myxococcaceae bacterium GXIMD 01537]